MLRRVMMLAVTLGLLGCDRPSPPPVGPATAPATSPATAPDAPPATQPAASYMIIDEQVVVFPPARIRLDKSDGRIVVLLFSDDPPSALEEEYEGNSFYLQIPLDIEKPEELASASWQFSSPSSQRSDSPFGVFLHGQRWRLQPHELHIEFEGKDSPILVRLSGVLLMFDTTDEKQPSRRVMVASELSAGVQRKPR